MTVSEFFDLVKFIDANIVIVHTKDCYEHELFKHNGNDGITNIKPIISKYGSNKIISVSILKDSVKLYI